MEVKEILKESRKAFLRHEGLGFHANSFSDMLIRKRISERGGSFQGWEKSGGG